MLKVLGVLGEKSFQVSALVRVGLSCRGATSDLQFGFSLSLILLFVANVTKVKETEGRT